MKGTFLCPNVAPLYTGMTGKEGVVPADLTFSQELIPCVNTCVLFCVRLWDEIHCIYMYF